jgi:hypothetical protein
MAAPQDIDLDPPSKDGHVNLAARGDPPPCLFCSAGVTTKTDGTFSSERFP